MAYNEQFNAQSRMQASFPSKQQLREADALAYAQRRGAAAGVAGVTTAAALLQERREFEEAAAIRDGYHAARKSEAAPAIRAPKAASKTCRELAERIKQQPVLSHEAVDDDFSKTGESIEIDETALKDILIQMLGKIHKLEREVKSLNETNNAQAELILKLAKKAKADSRASASTFDSAGS